MAPVLHCGSLSGESACRVPLQDETGRLSADFVSAQSVLGVQKSVMKKGLAVALASVVSTGAGGT